MQQLLKIVLLVYPIVLFIHPAKAETYFLKIAQEGGNNQETFLQTCSAKTHTVLKYSEKVIASFKAQAIKE